MMEEPKLQTNDNGEPAPSDERVHKISYWQVVWGQFSKNKVAVTGLWCIVVLIVIATYCPLVAMNTPFYIKLDNQASFPFVMSLFNRNFFENGVDIFFNLMMVLSPLYIFAYIALNAIGKSKTRFKLVSAIAIFHCLVFLCMVISPYNSRIGDYKTKIADAKMAGKTIACVMPPISYSYREIEIGDNPQPPSRKHLLGTDTEGRDVFTRMLYGTRISLTIGVVAVSIYVTIGIILGALAGYFGGKVDLLISRLIEVVICFPTFFLILTLAAFIEHRTIFHVMFIIGVVSWTGVARLVRGEFLRLREMDYVQAAIALGISRAKIIFSHILPNAMAPVLVAATFGVAAAILIESSLAFLGLGDPTAPSWGGILAVGRVQGKLWLILSPGIAIFIVVSVFNLVGEILRDAMDPKLRQ